MISSTTDFSNQSSATKNLRRHRFPPYRSPEEVAESSSDDNAAKFEDGFQQGLELGHKEGVSQGYQQGFSQGNTEGHQQGQQEGFTTGQSEGQQLFADSLAVLAKSQQQVEKLSRHKLIEQQSLITDIVSQVAMRVIRAELTLNPKQVLTLVEEAMLSLSDEVDKVRIFLNPEDKKRLHELGIDTLNNWPLEEEVTLAIGDCFIRSNQMEIAVDTQERFGECMTSVQQSLASTEGLVEAKTEALDISQADSVRPES